MAIGIIGAIASAAAGIISMQAQQSAMKKQEEANQQWANYQRRERAEAWQREEQYRQNAEAARQSTISEMDAQKQKEAQGKEEERLKQDITPTDVKPDEKGMVAIGDELLRGTGGGDPLVTQDLQKKINSAAVESRKRIANLATIQSYGGSQFGLQNRAQDLFNKSGQDIRFQGNLRQGNLGALGIAGNVEPAKIQTTPSYAGGIASSLASIAGKGLSSGFGS
ncbi:MAG TPA: hypothetical protein VJV87_02005 [Sphingomicrobium sp.]|nr:hypothetical protein [Sphingomicrobium sp.]